MKVPTSLRADQLLSLKRRSAVETSHAIQNRYLLASLEIHGNDRRGAAVLGGEVGLQDVRE